MKKLIVIAKSLVSRRLSAFFSAEAVRGRQKWVLFIILFLFAWTAQSQTQTSPQYVVDGGSTNPPCPLGNGLLKLRATCNGMSATAGEVRTNKPNGDLVGTFPIPAGNTQEIEVTPQSLAGGTYIVSLYCQSTLIKAIDFVVGSPAPTALITRANQPGSVGVAVCNTPGLALTLKGTEYPFSGATVAWSGAGTIANSGAAVTTVTNIPGGNQTYTYKVTKPGCTDASATVSVRVVQPPTVDPVESMGVCNDTDVGPINFTSAGNPGATFVWTEDNIGWVYVGTGNSNTGNGNFVRQPVRNPDMTPLTTTFSVTATVDGCAGPVRTFTITVLPDIEWATPGFAGPTISKNKNNYCSGEDITLSTNIPGLSYTWTGPGLGPNRTTTLPTVTATTVRDVNFLQSGYFNYTVKVQRASHCQYTISTDAGIEQGPTLAANPQSVCAGGVVDLTSAAVLGAANPAASQPTYSYWFNQACTVPILNPGTITNSGTYYIRAIGQCTLVKPVVVTITPSPTIALNPLQPICSSPQVQSQAFTLSSAINQPASTPNLTYTYWKDPAATVDLPDPDHIVLSGVYYIKGVAGVGGCPRIVPVPVTIYLPPNLRVNAPPPFCLPQSQISTSPLEVELSLQELTVGTAATEIDDPTLNPYSYWTDNGNGNGTGQPLPSAPSNTPGKIKITLLNQPPPSVNSATGERTYTYWVKARKTHTSTTPAKVCESSAQLVVKVNAEPKVEWADNVMITNPVSNPQTLTENLEKTAVCGDEKTNLRDLLKTPPIINGIAVTYQFFEKLNPTQEIGSMVGEGKYFIRGKRGDCLSPTTLPITIKKFDRPDLTVKDAGTCYLTPQPPQPLHKYPLGGMVTNFTGDYSKLSYFTSPPPAPDPAESGDFPNGELTLTNFSPNPTENQTGVTNRPIWVRGRKVYTDVTTLKKTCFSEVQQATFTVKPLPKMPSPLPSHEFLCNGGRTSLIPTDDYVNSNSTINKGGYPYFGPNGGPLLLTKTAAYTWVAEELVGTTNTPIASPADRKVTGYSSNSVPLSPTNSLFSQVLIRNSSASSVPLVSVRYTFRAFLNGCASADTRHIIVPVVNDPAPAVSIEEHHMCGAQTSNGAPTQTNIPLLTSPPQQGVYFNWRATAVPDNKGNKALGATPYITDPAIPGQGLGDRGPSTTATGGGVAPIVQTLTNTTDHNLIVKYEILPRLALPGTNAGYCVGKWGYTTVVVHPVPQMTKPLSNQTPLIACSNRLGTDPAKGTLGIQLESNVPEAQYYWTGVAPLGTVEKVVPTSVVLPSGVLDLALPEAQNPPPSPPQPSSAPNAPQAGLDFSNQIIRTTDLNPSSNVNIAFSVTPNQGFAADPTFYGCSGNPRNFTVTLRSKGYPIIQPPQGLLSSTPTPICAVPLGNTNPNVNPNVNIPLLANVDGAAVGATYTWEIGGDYSREDIPVIDNNGVATGTTRKWTFIKGFTNQTNPQSFPPSPPPALQATLKLDDKGPSNLESWRQTTDHLIYYDISATNDGCKGPAYRVSYNLRPDPYITRLDKVGGLASACNGDRVDLEVKSYYPDEKMQYRWEVPASPRPEGWIGGDAGNFEASPLPTNFKFTGKDPFDISVQVRPRHKDTQCEGATREIKITMQPKPDAQAVGENGGGGACLGNHSRLILSSPKGVDGTRFKWMPGANLSGLQLDPNKYAVPSIVPEVGPILDQWKLSPGAPDIVTPIHITYKITPSANGCEGDPILFDFTVYPIIKSLATSAATLDGITIGANGVCSGTPIKIELTPNPAVSGAKFKWDLNHSDKIKGMMPSGNGVSGPIEHTLYHEGEKAEEVTYSNITTRLSYSNPFVECVGPTVGAPPSVSIKVNPIPTLTEYRAEEAIVCSGKPSSLILHNSFEGKSPRDVVIYSWKTTPEVSATDVLSGQENRIGVLENLNAPYGYGYRALTNGTREKAPIVFEVTAKNASANVSPLKECESPPAYISVEVIPNPIMDDLPTGDAGICDGSNVYIPLTSTDRNGVGYTWTVTQPANPIGAGNANNVEGEGAIPKTEKTTNTIGTITGALKLKDNKKTGRVTYTIMPHIKYADLVCSADASGQKTKTVDVVILPAIKETPEERICSSKDMVDGIPFEFDSPSFSNLTTTFSWSNDNIRTGLGAGGTGTAANQIGQIGAFKAEINTTGRDEVSRITVIPFVGENTIPTPGLPSSSALPPAGKQCAGKAATITLSVLPAPIVQAIPETTILCGGAPKIKLSNSGNLSGTRYSWTAIPSGVKEVTLPGTPVTSFLEKPLEPTTVQPGTVAYTFYAVGENRCSSEPLEPPIIITVNPVPQAMADTPDEVCSGGEAVIKLTGRESSTGSRDKIPAMYKWRVSDQDNVDGYTNGSNPQPITEIRQTLTLSNTEKEGKLTYYIKPNANGCDGDEFGVEVKVRAGLRRLKASPPPDQSFCIGNDVTLSVEPDAADATRLTYRWYQSIDGGGDNTWQLVEDGDAKDHFSGASTKTLTIKKPPEKFNTRIFKAEVSDTQCPTYKLESTSAQLTESLFGAAISASPTTTLKVGEAVDYTYTGPVDGVTYQWDFGDGWKSKAQNPKHFYNAKGIFETRLSVDKGGCKKDLFISPVTAGGPDFYGDIITNVETPDKGVSAYPTPVKDALTIEAKEAISKVEIHSMQGAVVVSEKVNGTVATLKMNELAAGLYVVIITHKSGVARVKIVKL